MVSVIGGAPCISRVSGAYSPARNANERLIGPPHRGSEAVRAERSRVARSGVNAHFDRRNPLRASRSRQDEQRSGVAGGAVEGGELGGGHG